MTASGARGAREIEVVREYEALPPCAVDRHRLMEILVNVIQNARQALEAGATREPRLALHLRRLGPDRARIEVCDNGIGIAPENLARVFTHGFTTRKDGHGFGLHASANAATEMGGVVRARSDGSGRGATFEIEFPVRSRETAGAAA